MLPIVNMLAGQEGRLSHGYYKGYCYLPLHVFCGDHLLVGIELPMKSPRR